MIIDSVEISLKKPFPPFATDLYQIYHSPCMDPDAGPTELRNKVEWDLRFYFCRRGKQNVYSFKKDTFKLSHHEEWDLRYIEKAVDEETKNHKGIDKGIPSGFMPEIKGSKYCPVTSYLTYLYSLDPLCEWLWQTPKLHKFPENGKGVWYKGRMGHNKLDTFVSRMARLAGLSHEGYSNHSLRSSGITLLKKDQRFRDKQVMVFSGHTSLQGLNIYDRVTPEEKIQMGNHLGNQLTNQPIIAPLEGNNVPAIAPAINAENQQQLALPPPPNATAAVSVAPDNALVLYANEDPLIAEDVPPQHQQEANFNLMDFLDSGDEETITVSQQVQKVSNNNQQSVFASNQIMQKKASPRVPVFHGCKIGNITININKN